MKVYTFIDVRYVIADSSSTHEFVLLEIIRNIQDSDKQQIKDDLRVKDHF